MNALHRFIPAAITFVALSTSACVTMESTARTRAANDLSCPEDSVAVRNIGGTSFRATGCGQEATYNCVQSSQNTLACVREEQRPAPTAVTSSH